MILCFFSMHSPNYSGSDSEAIDGQNFQCVGCGRGFLPTSISGTHKRTETRSRSSAIHRQGKRSFGSSCLGLAGAPAAYQSHMEDVLLDIDGVIVYIDDFLYYSDTVEEHLITLERVFERLVKNNIFLHPLKCVWGVTKLNYLGLTISPGLVSVFEEKIAALKAYAIPQGVADVRRYLCFVQYLAVFVPKFAELTAPIQVSVYYRGRT